MPSAIGFASLAGSVVNAAIPFSMFFQSHPVGDDYVAASLNAVRDRFRPILPSTSTKTMGLALIILVGPVFPSILPICFDIVGVRKWSGNFDSEMRAAAV